MNRHVFRAVDSACRFDELSNEDLLASTQKLVGATNQVLAALLAHLGEVEARGIHRDRACASLYTYCVYELRMSEDAAFRRARAARIVRDFPVMLGAVARGELHLTGLLMLGPHLTDENHAEVLALAKHRTKREITQLVRKLDPLPDVPARVEPLGPASARHMGPAEPAWADMVGAFASPVRGLPPGERPADWVTRELAVPASSAEALAATPEAEASPVARAETRPIASAEARPAASAAFSETQRFKVQFTASQQYVDLLEEARDLLSHALPRATLDEVHVRALQALVTELRKKKYGATGEPTGEPRVAEPATKDDEPRGRGRGRGRARHVPARVRRTVVERDGERCTYVDPVTGQRCRETRMLELHHQHAHALGGHATAKNLTLRCRAHNRLAAEQDFGRDFMADRIAPREPRRSGNASNDDRSHRKASDDDRTHRAGAGDGGEAGARRAGAHCAGG